MSDTASEPAATDGHLSAPAPPRVKKRSVFAWSLWDWGSAAFQAVVTTFVFSVYITSAAFGPEDETSVALGATLSIAGVAVAVFAPLFGRLTDATGRRKHSLAVTTGIVIACTALMVLVAPAPEYLVLGLVLLAVGNIAFEFASVNYYSMLTQLSTPGNIGRISGFGWGMGYLGGIVLLTLVLVGFILPDAGWFGVSSEGGWNVRIAMVLCALWFAVFAIPTFFAVPEVPADDDRRVVGMIAGYRAIFSSIAGLWRTSRHTLFFLIASAVFRDGLAGIFTFVGVVASLSFGFDPATVIMFAIAANVISGIATIFGGLLEDRFGAKNIMTVSLVLLVVGLILMFALAPLGAPAFWAVGLFSTIFVGPVQSSSRSFLARLAPPGREGEMFGLYATTGRAVSFLAPAAFTASVAIGGATIFGTLGIGLVLLVGLALLLPVRVPATAAGSAG